MSLPPRHCRFDYHPSDEALLPQLIADVRHAPSDSGPLKALATELITRIRATSSGIGGLEDFLREYDIGTREGLALMVMAEALLRIPDAATQEALIEEKIGVGDWTSASVSDDAPLFVAFASRSLDLSTRMLGRRDAANGLLSTLAKRIGPPALRTGVRQAMRFLGHQFVLGETIESALSRARSSGNRSYRFSYDMLGEGARAEADAQRFFQSYHDAIEAIGQDAPSDQQLPNRPGISVKLSALHPRYDPRQRQAVLDELVPKVVALAAIAQRHQLNFTIDAEEADRLELSIEVIDAVLADLQGSGVLEGWTGFGLAIQAYQKRAVRVIDVVHELAEKYDTTLMVRLVKGAYWDTEIKRAQTDGLEDFPVFTRKAATDVGYLACAKKLLSYRPRLYPQFATHNALTVATLIEMAREHGAQDALDGFEFQRLHGMGDALYTALARDGIKLDGEDRERLFATRVYAPVGGHQDLLAYLVRRLLENGANSSFVARVGDRSVAIESLLVRPVDVLDGSYRHSGIALPKAVFAPRRNSKGLAFGCADDLFGLLEDIQHHDAAPLSAGPLIGGELRVSDGPGIPSPIDGHIVGSCADTNEDQINEAFARAEKAVKAWGDIGADERASVLERAASLLEKRRARFFSLLQREAGKTLDDAIAELREAVDFLRYYASEARRLFVDTELPGPVGESNQLRLTARGVVVTIAPWNFPLAIFLGQTSAALAAGNACIAKPAPQTPLVAFEAIRLMHEAGVPVDVLALLPGGRDTGKRIVEHPAVAAVAFTGSGAAARAIAMSLAEKTGAIVPLIAETGGVNAMIVDATALPEQVTDDVVMSAFRSAGQRCSALRVLYLQEDVADRMLEMIEGAAAAMNVGDPRDIATDVGPIIDAEARQRLQQWLSDHSEKIRWSGRADSMPADGHWLAPQVLEWPADQALDQEVFGPILHVKRWKAGELDAVLEEIAATGFGLTFGVHSRIDAVIERCVAGSTAGNIYVNRNTIGAIVGSQPFGGGGLSGTGPKAGGPNYLLRFAEERVVSTDTTAAGGNASLMATSDIE